MDRLMWAELEAQVEDHGHEAVQFYLDQEDPETGENMVLDVMDISFVDGEIRVLMS